ncbi:MAG: glutamate synthase, partial [Clostridiales bacterium]|nr:glutamate synthase [Clostridiales bacterium]
MSIILAGDLHFSALRDRIEAVPKGEKVIIENCLGQRFIASGRSGVNIEIHGTPGNDLGSYLDGGVIEVFGNAQDATADTMNDGEIIIHGSSGDATGYAMRGGRILIEGNVGYRAGIHMKAYKNKIPVMVVGGRGGNFLAEYQAGGKIIVLGLHTDGKPIVGAFCGTGQHGGAVYLRGECPGDLPKQII